MDEVGVSVAVLVRLVTVSSNWCEQSGGYRVMAGEILGIVQVAL